MVLLPSHSLGSKQRSPTCIPHTGNFLLLELVAFKLPIDLSYETHLLHARNFPNMDHGHLKKKKKSVWFLDTV